MLNSSQKNNLIHSNVSSSNSINSKGSYIPPINDIDEIEQLMSKQRLTDHHYNNLSDSSTYFNQPINSQCTKVNEYKMNPIILNNVNSIANQTNHQNLSDLNVSNMNNKYLSPNYENLNALKHNQFKNNQSFGNRSFNNPSPQSISSSIRSNQKMIFDPNLISPNIPGLPEPSIKKNLSNQHNIYTNGSIVSRYVPPVPSNETYSNYPNQSKYLSSNFINNTRDNQTNSIGSNSKYITPINELDSLYDPVYFRSNSQLSFNSKEDLIDTYTPPSISSSISQAAGANLKNSHRKPINAFFNNELDQVYDESIRETKNINPISRDKEVDFLTNLLVKEMQTSTDPDYYGKCFKCGKAIFGSQNGCTALNQLYHVECFSCSVCDKTLRGSVPFYVMEGKPMCEEDYLSTLDKCFVCNKPILDRILRAMGNSYHPKCFCCVECGVCLDGILFTVDHKNKLHCIEDFHEKFAPRCSACLKPIIPENGQIETVRIVVLDRIFHVSCYRCEDCGVLLSSEKDGDGKGCYPLDNHILCKECNNIRFQKYLNLSSNQLN